MSYHWSKYHVILELLTPDIFFLLGGLNCVMTGFWIVNQTSTTAGWMDWWASKQEPVLLLGYHFHEVPWAPSLWVLAKLTAGKLTALGLFCLGASNINPSSLSLWLLSLERFTAFGFLAFLLRLSLDRFLFLSDLVCSWGISSHTILSVD